MPKSTDPKILSLFHGIYEVTELKLKRVKSDIAELQTEIDQAKKRENKAKEVLSLLNGLAWRYDYHDVHGFMSKDTVINSGRDLKVIEVKGDHITRNKENSEKWECLKVTPTKNGPYNVEYVPVADLEDVKRAECSLSPSRQGNAT